MTTQMTAEEKVQKLGFLIECLEHEMPEYAKYTPPKDPETAFDLYRSLCNVRMPQGRTGHTLPDDFYTVQAEVLHAVTAEKGIVDAAALPASKLDARLALWQGDITTLAADAIVNAANNQMLGCFQPLHGCIDNIIHTMAGTELREECLRIMREQGKPEPTGRAKMTAGYNLPAEHVIHTVGPIVSGPLTKRLKDQLASCYASVLDLAAENGLRTVAFCCISTGVFHFPPNRAAEIAVRTVREWLDAHPGASVERVVFNVFKDSDRDLYDALLNA